jgi:D-glycero-D-manno-heptose 1,7-bisphosphate phosphatase
MLGTEITSSLRLLFSELPRSGIQPAIFLDRDGVINRQFIAGYVTRWSDFTFRPGIRKTIAALSTIGCPIIVISNQACIAKGLVEVSTLVDITNRFVAALKQSRGRIDAVYYCPHSPAERCCCRKPAAGLLKIAAHDWRIDLSRSVLIGDSLTDVEAARAVNCRALLLSHRNDSIRPTVEGAVSVSSMAEATDQVRKLVAMAPLWQDLQR